jgi:hypothetical protein
MIASFYPIALDDFFLVHSTRGRPEKRMQSAMPSLSRLAGRFASRIADLSLSRQPTLPAFGSLGHDYCLPPGSDKASFGVCHCERRITLRSHVFLPALSLDAL